MSTTNAQFVHQMYITYLQRPAEPAGHAFWVSELESGAVTREELAAQFGGSEEFAGRFTEANRAELINEVYQALFGRDAEAEGLAFWMSEDIDIALLPTVIAEASADWDGDTLQNRLTFAEKLMDSLSQEQYESVTQEQLREMLSNVTEDTEVTDEFVADVVAGVELGDDTDTSELTEALENLQNAQLAKTEFLKEAAATEAQIATAVTAADSALGVVNYEDSAGNAQTINVYAPGAVSAGGDSDRVKAAKVADAEAALATKLKDAQEDLAAAQAEVAKVSGLKSAIDLYNARVEAQEATADALLAAEAAEAGAVASYNKVHSTATITPDPTSGVDTSVIVKNSTTGRLELVSGVTETTNPGIGAVLTTVQARVDADEANEAALNAIKAAVIAIGYIDVGTGKKDDIGAEFATPVAPGAASDKLTQSEIQVELNAQLAAAEELGELTFDGAGLITHIDGIAIGAEPAVVAYNALKGEVNNFENSLVVGAPAYTFATADKTAAQIAEQTAVADAELAIKALADAVEALESAKAVAADLKGYDDAIKAAEDAFEALEVEAPVTVGGTVVGTAENDLFLVSDKPGSIVNFDAQGDDLIFVGTNYAELKVLTAAEVVTGRVGDATVFEIFAKQNGSNVDLWVEQESFAGNATGDADLVKITLAGVSVDDLVLNEGFIALA